MNRRSAGFTLIELLIAVAIVGFVLAAAATFFVLSVRQYVVQSKIVETNVEGVLGLELLRKDLDGLGFGLPWNNLGSYTERPGPGGLSTTLNDASGVAPRAVVAVDNVSSTISVNQSDYLVIKSASVGMKNAAGKWTTLDNNGNVRNWSPTEENLDNTDRVIVISLGSVDSNRRLLVNSSSLNLQFSGVGASAYLPIEPYISNVVYGIDNVAGGLKRPFNRADYFIANNNTTASNRIDVPQRCAPITGVLVKAVIPHTDPETPASTDIYPLLDCVADMQVVFKLDTGWATPDGLNSPKLNASDLRARLQEIRVSVLTHEGGVDTTYTHPVNPVYVGMEDAGGGRNFDITGYTHYRWKVYYLVIKPWNLAQ